MPGRWSYRPDSSPEQLSRAAGVVRDGVHQALDELRQLIAVLREDGDPPTGGVGGLGTADVPDLVEQSRAAGTVVRLDNRPDGYREQTLHRVLFAGHPAPEELAARRSSWGAARLAVGDDPVRLGAAPDRRQCGLVSGMTT